MAYVKAIARTGAYAVKFQTHIAEYESSINERFRTNIFPQDETRFEYWNRTAFKSHEWKLLSDYCESLGIIFATTPFSIEAAKLVAPYNKTFWKVGSGDLTNLPLIDYLASTHLPIILSTGMASIDEIDRTVQLLDSLDATYSVLQCTTQYPCPPKSIGLNLLNTFRERYNCDVGLSDHSGTIYPSLAAATLGATYVEVHTVFSKQCFGPDVSSSVTLDELSQIVEGSNFIHQCISCDYSKDLMSEELSGLALLFGKSLYASKI